MASILEAAYLLSLVSDVLCVKGRVFLMVLQWDRQEAVQPLGRTPRRSVERRTGNIYGSGRTCLKRTQQPRKSF